MTHTPSTRPCPHCKGNGRWEHKRNKAWVVFCIHCKGSGKIHRPKIIVPRPR